MVKQKQIISYSNSELEKNKSFVYFVSTLYYLKKCKQGCLLHEGYVINQRVLKETNLVDQGVLLSEKNLLSIFGPLLNCLSCPFSSFSDSLQEYMLSRHLLSTCWHNSLSSALVFTLGKAKRRRKKEKKRKCIYMY